VVEGEGIRGAQQVALEAGLPAHSVHSLCYSGPADVADVRLPAARQRIPRVFSFSSSVSLEVPAAHPSCGQAEHRLGPPARVAGA
jgi:hypothetical protein